MHFLSICIFFWITCPNMVTPTNLGTKGDNTAHLHCYLSKITTVSFQHEGKLLRFDVLHQSKTELHATFKHSILTSMRMIL